MKENWKENETEKHKTWGFADHVFYKKAKSSKNVKKMILATYYFFKFSEKRKTRRKRKHKGTFLSQRTNKEGTQFLLKQKQLQKEAIQNTLLFLWRRESKKGRKNDDQTKQRNQKKRSIKRDQQRKTFKNENKKEKCLKTHKNKSKEGKIEKRRTNMQKQILMKKCTKKKEMNKHFFFNWRSVWAKGHQEATRVCKMDIWKVFFWKKQQEGEIVVVQRKLKKVK